MAFSRVNLLDHGFVELVDSMGTDESIVNAARISYSGGTKKSRDDRALIRYLMNHRHWSPFEMCEVVFHLKLPIFVMRQLMRHRTLSFNEISGRYSVLSSEMYLPEDDRLCFQSEDNKQGSGEPMDIQSVSTVKQFIRDSNEDDAATYSALIESNLARELARIVLPVSTYTEVVCKANLRNWFHFLELRLDAHAQHEIRVYAETIAEEIRRLFPTAYSAFEDYVLNARTFSGPELVVLRVFLATMSKQGHNPPPLDGMSKREAKEFRDKLGL